ncbi:endoplasmic reticulum membrane-associated RNA degradation protein [Rhincodon typus]|uniref:endoplasmic reticulum membrane-associated RNA degradation protein n=1 Tax=Rhincodon typus TaxID=259920 RepID=UPI00202FC226|nr:endoplasmic reticulum membrane-associated RNA degradation protein [Rhincodon typus]
MATFEHIKTCLSAEVHHMVCSLGLTVLNRPELERIITVSGEICWEAITFYLHTSDAEKHDLDYIESVRSLGPVCKTVHLYLLSLSTQHFNNQYGLWFKWTNNRELFVEAFEAIRSAQPTAVSLSLMKLTACLERALGDGHCLKFLQPENSHFCLCNFCFAFPQSTTLYTTFDEMLAKYLDNGVINHLPSALGDPIMEILWDLLNHQEGPRLRDHLSHGEIDLKLFPREMASHVVALAIILLHHCHRGANGIAMENECLRTIMCSTHLYCSRFHPVGRLKQQLRRCLESLQKWGEIPRPTLEQASDRPGSDCLSPAAQTVHRCLMEGLVSALINRLKMVYDEDLNPFHYLLAEAQLHLVAKLLANRIGTLYCSRVVLELVSLLRKITSQCLTVSEQIMHGAVSRHQQWLSKSLRSRQRQNYLRMLGSVQYLHHIFSLLTLLVAVELLNAQTMVDETSSEYHRHLKFLKSVLQYTENMVTYTSPDKNKWNESWDLTEKMLLKVKNFYNK